MGENCRDESCDQSAKSSILQMESRKPGSLEGASQWVGKMEVQSLQKMAEDFKSQYGDVQWSKITPEVRKAIEDMQGLCKDIEGALEAEHNDAQENINNAVMDLDSTTTVATTLKRGGEKSADALDGTLITCRTTEKKLLAEYEQCRAEEAKLIADRDTKCAKKKSLQIWHFEFDSSTSGLKTCDWSNGEVGNPPTGCADYLLAHDVCVDVKEKFKVARAEYVKWSELCKTATKLAEEKRVECVNRDQVFMDKLSTCDELDGKTTIVKCEFGDKLQEKCYSLDKTEKLINSITNVGGHELSDLDRRKEWDAVQIVRCCLSTYQDGGTFSSDKCELAAYPWELDTKDAKRKELTTVENFHCMEESITFSGYRIENGDTAAEYTKSEDMPAVMLRGRQETPFAFCAGGSAGTASKPKPMCDSLPGTQCNDFLSEWGGEGTCVQHAFTRGYTCKEYCGYYGRNCVRGMDNATVPDGAGSTLCGLYEEGHERQSTAENGCLQKWNTQICACGGFPQQ